MAGGMGVRKNVHIENWASFRENCEHVFKFSKSNWARLAVFGIALPVAFYRLIVNELETPGHAVGHGPEKFNRGRVYMGGSRQAPSSLSDALDKPE